MPGVGGTSNHPHRRLDALAELVRRWKEVRLLSPRLEEVAKWIGGLSHPFWDHHFTLTSGPTVQPFHLLGQTRINEILANVIYPMLVATNQSDWESYKKVRAELSNRHPDHHLPAPLRRNQSRQGTPSVSLSAAGAPADLRRFLPRRFNELRQLSIP
jgi:hypothetical protein